MQKRLIGLLEGHSTIRLSTASEDRGVGIPKKMTRSCRSKIREAHSSKFNIARLSLGWSGDSRRCLPKSIVFSSTSSSKQKTLVPHPEIANHALQTGPMTSSILLLTKAQEQLTPHRKQLHSLARSVYDHTAGAIVSALMIRSQEVVNLERTRASPGIGLCQSSWVPSLTCIFLPSLIFHHHSKSIPTSGGAAFCSLLFRYWNLYPHRHIAV